MAESLVGQLADLLWFLAFGLRSARTIMNARIQLFISPSALIAASTVTRISAAIRETLTKVTDPTVSTPGMADSMVIRIFSKLEKALDATSKRARII